ncbi:hypothetical protein GGI12_001374 [Dipsacomyces acuminosporus]|nr:hypothetical protein GGI12_001374 [Dipsacomyces acuminosporus]
MRKTATPLPELRRQRQTNAAAIANTVREWTRNRRNMENIELHQSLVGHDGCVNALCWSHDGRYLFSGSDDSTICVWRAAGDGYLVCRLRSGFDERVFDLKILPHPNDHLLVACSMDSSVKVFDINLILAAASAATTPPYSGSRPSEDSILSSSEFCIRTFGVHTAAVKRAATIPDSPFEFLTCSEDGTARHFDLRERPLLSRVQRSRLLRGGHIVADYKDTGAELHALDVNPFIPSIFAVGGSMTSIMVHDRRMARTDSMHQRQDQIGDKCIVRLRRGRDNERTEGLERATNRPVTALRFSRDTPNQIIGSWSYDNVYLFDLNESPTFRSSIQSESLLPRKIRSRESFSDTQTPPLVKRIRSDSGATMEPSSCNSGAGILPGPQEASGDRSSVSAAIEPEDSDSEMESFDSAVFRIPLQRGPIFGMRVLSRDEAPYLFNSDDSDSDSASTPLTATTTSNNTDTEHPDNSAGPDSRCRYCKGERGRLLAAFRDTEGTEDEKCDLYAAIPPSTLEVINVAFNSFISSKLGGLLRASMGSLSFAIRQLEGDSVQPSEGSARALQTAGSFEGMPKTMDIWKAFYKDPALERNRIKSILYNCRACVSAEIFRIRLLNRFSAYMETDVRTYDISTLQTILRDFESTRSDLDSTTRDSDLALEMNRYNILAHFNRLLIELDRVLFNLLAFIVELLPASGDLARAQGDRLQDNNDPVTNRLRADFGDIAQRMKELHTRINSSLDAVRSGSRLLQKLCAQYQSGINTTVNSDAEALLRHNAERFYTVPPPVAADVARNARYLAGKLDDCRPLFGEDEISLLDATDYVAILLYLVRCWKKLTTGNAGEQSHLGQLNLARILERGLYEPKSAGGLIPFAHLWHRFLHYFEDSTHIDQECHEYYVDDSMEYEPEPLVRITDLEDDQLLLETDRVRAGSQASPAAPDTVEEAAATDRESSASGSTDSDMLQVVDIDIDVDDSTPSTPQSTSRWPRETEEHVPRATRSSRAPNWTRSLFSSILRSSDESSSAKSTDSRSTAPPANSRTIPVVFPCMRYGGHCNYQTVKDVNFVFGKYVASGSDDGRLFMWDRDTMEIVQIIKGDSEVVNIIEGHPTLPIIAVSGIDSTIQLFSLCQGGPSAMHRKNFPLVREQHFSLANITSQADRSVFSQEIYSRDPYYKDLERSEHLPLPASTDYDEMIKHIPRQFPAISASELADKDRIIEQNDDMRKEAIANASLSERLLHHILYGHTPSENNIGSSEQTSDSSMDSEGWNDDDDSDMTSLAAISSLFDSARHGLGSRFGYTPDTESESGSEAEG